MKKILLSFLVIFTLQMVVNCSSLSNQNSSGIPKNYQIQREWMLVSFNHFTKADLIKNKSKIDLTSTMESGKIRGEAFMGCNTLFFTSEFKNNGKLKISAMDFTEKACEDMKLEDDFSKSFKNMTNYKVEGHFLTLTDGQGNAMKFIAADWD